MKVEKNKVVSIAYTIYEHEPDGEAILEIPENDPEVFLFDDETEEIPFYSRLKGLSIGDTFSFVLEPEDAFGEYDEDEIIDSSLSDFADMTDVDAKDIEKDMYFSYYNDDGEEEFFKVKNINKRSNKITLDFNHPFAGKKIKVEGKIIEIKEPDNE